MRCAIAGDEIYMSSQLCLSHLSIDKQIISFDIGSLSTTVGLAAATNRRTAGIVVEENGV
jgi:hypothetical protein